MLKQMRGKIQAGISKDSLHRFNDLKSKSNKLSAIDSANKTAYFISGILKDSLS